MRKDLREQGRIILAHGEVTGHCHEVVSATEMDLGIPPAQYFEEPDGTRMLLVDQPCALRHQEHAPIALYPSGPAQMWRQGDVLGVPVAPGTWRIVRQREWDGPEQWRQVAD